LAPVRRPLQVRGFPALATSYAINELGDNLGVVALAILVLDQTGSALAVTALFVAGKFVPALVAPALTAGLDHRRVSHVLPALYILEAGAFAALASIAGVFSLPAVLALAFVDGLLALTGRGLSRGAIAAVLTPHGALRAGNALINVVFAIMSAAGPVMAGLIVHEWGVATALWFDSASFWAIAILLLASARSLPEPESGPHEPWRARIRDGWEYVRDHPTAGRLITGEAVAILFFTLVIPIEVVYAKETLNSTSLGFGVLMASWGVGIILGSALFARSRGRSLRTLVLVSTAAIGAGYAVMAGAPTLLVACLAVGGGDDRAAGSRGGSLSGAGRRAPGVGGGGGAGHRLHPRRSAHLGGVAAAGLRGLGGRRRGGRRRVGAAADRARSRHGLSAAAA
jgi:MFS family permease